MADPVDQPQFHGPLAQPDFTGEQIDITGQLVRATRCDVVFEIDMDIFKQCLETGNVVWVLGPERVQHAFGFTSCVDTPFNAVTLYEPVQAERGRDDAD